MTIVRRTSECLKRFKEDFKKGLFSNDDGMVLAAWAREMENYGPDYIAKSAEWRDHPLDREWMGYRASCFSTKGRIIYKVIDEETVEVCIVERVTPNHDYKGRKK